ncbi:hypothetical protein [Photobacterium kishitanii]|uniref:hypothetical protein n=1 Tax=Photobacterium kishitanii TaxID=318456 RepID=UPI00273A216A|nr:hypothetical protein [Photobacterium kishitanii]
MLWFLMVTLPLVLAGIHKLLLVLGVYPRNNSVFIIPIIIICYCIFAVSSAFDREALPAVLIAILLYCINDNDRKSYHAPIRRYIQYL